MSLWTWSIWTRPSTLARTITCCLRRRTARNPVRRFTRLKTPGSGTSTPSAPTKYTVEPGGRVADALRAFKTFLFNSDMMAYLAMMAPRLVELRRVLKETGSIYLHCDPAASHYLKILMDAVFGPQFFR